MWFLQTIRDSLYSLIQNMDIDADGSIFKANDYEGNVYIFYVFVYIEETSGDLYLPYWKRIQTMEGYDGSQS
jgi:hypothetical protein